MLKDYEELQSRCNNVLADLTIKTASLQAVTSQLVTEEGKCQELTVKVGVESTEPRLPSVFWALISALVHPGVFTEGRGEPFAPGGEAPVEALLG